MKGRLNAYHFLFYPLSKASFDFVIKAVAFFQAANIHGSLLLLI